MATHHISAPLSPLVAIVRWLMPPIVKFGIPLRMTPAEDTVFFHVPVSVEPWLFGKIGPAVLDDAEIYLDWHGEDRRTLRLCWGDATAEKPQTTTLLRRGSERLVPIVYRTEKEKEAYVTDVRYFELGKKTVSIKPVSSPRLFSLRVKSGTYERNSPNLYSLIVPDNGSNGHFSLAIDASLQSVRKTIFSPKKNLGPWSLLATILLTLLFIAYWAIFGFGPHEGDTAYPMISVAHITPHLRDPKTGRPFSLSVFEDSVGPPNLPHSCGLPWMTTSTVPMTADIAAENFRQMIRRLDLEPVASCPPHADGTPPNSIYYYDVYQESGYMPDAYVQEINSGTRYLYLFLVWKYRIAGDSNVYVQEFCTYWQFDMIAQHACPGDHAGAFVHKEP